jgi:hypothetical protein
MTLYREAPEFWPTIGAAAAQRDLSVEIVEKDYWVTETLRVLAAEFPDDFVFKGGTSLSKAYGCVERFSEDVDILVLLHGRGRSALERLMKRMASTVAGQLAMTPGDHNRGRGTHHNEHLIYPSQFTGDRMPAPDVYLEMGVRGEDLPPHEFRVIRSILSEELLQADGFDINDYGDLSAFSVPTLHAARTLVEKAMLLHVAVTTEAWHVDGTARSSGIGRHYCDVYELLGMEQVLEWLSDREGFLAVVASHEAINREWFDTVVPPRPQGGYADSEAFSEAYEGNPDLALLYERAMRDLHFRPGGWPPWTAVMGRIQESRSLL